jgi:predicted RNA-binding protein Jag
VVPEERLKEIEAQIAAFAVDESRTESLAFPASLPSHERKVVHRLAEEYNLSHESFGLGKERHIQVHPPPTCARVRLCARVRAGVRARAVLCASA